MTVRMKTKHVTVAMEKEGKIVTCAMVLAGEHVLSATAKEPSTGVTEKKFVQIAMERRSSNVDIVKEAGVHALAVTELEKKDMWGTRNNSLSDRYNTHI